MIEQLIIHQIGLSSEIYLRLIELCKMVYVRKEERLLTSTRKSVIFYRDSQVGCTPFIYQKRGRRT